MQEDNISSNGGGADGSQGGGFLVNLLTGWGVPGSLARMIAGAVLGAISALWAASQAG